MDPLFLYRWNLSIRNRSRVSLFRAVQIVSSTVYALLVLNYSVSISMTVRVLVLPQECYHHLHRLPPAVDLQKLPHDLRLVLSSTT